MAAIVFQVAAGSPDSNVVVNKVVTPIAGESQPADEP